MARRLVSTVWVDSPNAGPKAFGPQDRVEDIPEWAYEQMGDHCFEEYDPSQQAPADTGPDAGAESRRLQGEVVDLRADNDNLREERDGLRARIAELEASLAETSGTEDEAGDGLEDKNVDELKALAKERGIEGAAGLRRAELLTALRNQGQ